MVRLVWALLLEQNDEWTVQRYRILVPEPIAAMSDDPLHKPARCGKLTHSRLHPESTAIAEAKPCLGHDQLFCLRWNIAHQ